MDKLNQELEIEDILIWIRLINMIKSATFWQHYKNLLPYISSFVVSQN